jgi:hypothetical protein
MPIATPEFVNRQNQRHYGKSPCQKHDGKRIGYFEFSYCILYRCLRRLDSFGSKILKER